MVMPSSSRRDNERFFQRRKTQRSGHVSSRRRRRRCCCCCCLLCVRVGSCVVSKNKIIIRIALQSNFFQLNGRSLLRSLILAPSQNHQLTWLRRARVVLQVAALDGEWAAIPVPERTEAMNVMVRSDASFHYLSLSLSLQ